ncbi:nuclear transport factor 2 family protein [Paraburkholderia strydomiana]|jgi:hypothetical protein|uniref:nuclear transport factor 2 family protein n=1 Tax=Paraburkholderia strydomiana TaxID=1245417 RepID=UPI0038BB82EC
MLNKLSTHLFPVAALLLAALSLSACNDGGGIVASAGAAPVTKVSHVDDYFEIQFLQGRYNHAMNSNRLDLIPQFFAQQDADVTLDLPDNTTGTPVKGLTAITQEFAKLKGMVTSQGDFMGTHLVTTPVIKVSDDGLTAQGSWMSYGFTLMGPAFGNKTPPYPTAPVIGRYSHDFVKENGVWKFKHFKWAIFASLPPTQYDPATAGPGWANTPMTPGSKAAAWPLDPIDQ